MECSYDSQSAPCRGSGFASSYQESIGTRDRVTMFIPSLNDAASGRIDHLLGQDY